jgi:hypothetical protein
VLGLLHGIVAGEVAVVLEVYAAFVFDPEDGDSTYLQSVGNIAYNHKM